MTGKDCEGLRDLPVSIFIVEFNPSWGRWAHEGQKAAKLTVTNDGCCNIGNTTPIQITQTGTYRFNSRAKASGDIHHLTIAIWKSEILGLRDSY